MGEGERDARRYRPGRRALLIAVGGAMTIVGAAAVGGLLVLLGQELRAGRLHGTRLAEAVGISALVALLFGAFAAMGLSRVAAGIRGAPPGGPTRMARADGWLRRNWYLFHLVTWGLLAAWLGHTQASPGRRPGAASPVGYVWHGFLLLLLLPLHVAVHEGGHALVARLLGFRFEELRIGWVSIRREAGRARVTWSPPSVAGVLGFHRASTDLASARPFRVAAMAMAGPATSLLAALACRAGGAALGLPASAAQAVAADLLQAGVWLGAGLTVLNLIPVHTASGFLTDGALALFWLRATPGRLALQRFHAAWAQGLRPREWGIGAEQLLAAAEEEESRDALLLAALAVALDRGDEGQASEVLRRAAQAKPTDPRMRRELELQAAMVEAFAGRAVEARARLGRIAPVPDMPAYVRLAQAAVLRAEGREAEAQAALADWERAAQLTGQAAQVLVGNQWAVERLRTGDGGRVEWGARDSNPEPTA